MSTEIHHIAKLPINFIRYDYEVNQKVKLKFNACNSICKCYWTKEQAPFLEVDTEYTIEAIAEFGGGCPSISLRLKEVPETHSEEYYDKKVPANWFEPIT